MKLTEDQADGILQTLRQIDKSLGYVVANTESMEDLFASLDERGEVTSIDANEVSKIVTKALRSNVAFTNPVPNQNNVLIVRYAIIQFFTLYSDRYSGIIKNLNSPEGQKKCAETLQKEIDNADD